MKILKYSRISKINLGDVLISDVINLLDSSIFQNEIKNYDILFEDFNLKKRLNETNEKINIPYKVDKYKNFRILVYLFKRLKFYFVDKKKFFAQIKNMDVVIIGGGNILSESYSNDMFFRVLKIVKISKKLKKPVIILGVGIGDFQFNYKDRLKWLINHSDVFSVRDMNSKEICLDVGKINKPIDLIPDPAFVISDYFPSPLLDKRKKFIGFNFMNLGRICNNKEHDINTIVLNLKKLHNYYSKPIKIINTSYGEDYSISKIIQKELNLLKIENIIYNIECIEDVEGAFSDLDFFIANRMHSSIFSMSYGIKTLIYPWDKKIIFLLKLLHKNKSIDSFTLSSINFDSNEIIAKITDYENDIDFGKLIAAIKKEITHKYEAFITRIL